MGGRFHKGLPKRRPTPEGARSAALPGLAGILMGGSGAIRPWRDRNRLGDRRQRLRDQPALERANPLLELLDPSSKRAHDAIDGARAGVGEVAHKRLVEHEPRGRSRRRWRDAVRHRRRADDAGPGTFHAARVSSAKRGSI